MNDLKTALKNERSDSDNKELRKDENSVMSGWKFIFSNTNLYPEQLQ